MNRQLKTGGVVILLILSFLLCAGAAEENGSLGSDGKFLVSNETAQLLQKTVSDYFQGGHDFARHMTTWMHCCFCLEMNAYQLLSQRISGGEITAASTADANGEAQTESESSPENVDGTHVDVTSSPAPLDVTGEAETTAEPEISDPELTATDVPAENLVVEQQQDSLAKPIKSHLPLTGGLSTSNVAVLLFVLQLLFLLFAGIYFLNRKQSAKQPLPQTEKLIDPESTLETLPTRPTEQKENFHE